MPSCRLITERGVGRKTPREKNAQTQCLQRTWMYRGRIGFAFSRVAKNTDSAYYGPDAVVVTRERRCGQSSCLSLWSPCSRVGQWESTNKQNSKSAICQMVISNMGNKMERTTGGTVLG